jgi:ABC-type sugar transport system permease subunit
MIPEYVALGRGSDPWLVVVLSLAAVVTALLAGLGLAAFLRRRSRSYLLVTLAIVTLFARTAVATAAMLGLISASPHHLIEHGLDTLMTVFVVAAVYYARSVAEPHATQRG